MIKFFRSLLYIIYTIKKIIYKIIYYDKSFDDKSNNVWVEHFTKVKK